MSQFQGVRQRCSAARGKKIQNPACRFRVAAGRENDFRFRAAK